MNDEFGEMNEVEKRVTYKLGIPQGGRVVASSIDNSGYDYTSMGGFSWTFPYIAGLYALACQVDSDITFDEFLSVLRETAIILKDINQQDYGILLIDPVKAIEFIYTGCRMGE